MPGARQPLPAIAFAGRNVTHLSRNGGRFRLILRQSLRKNRAFSHMTAANRP
jgi:hypothetical protein